MTSEAQSPWQDWVERGNGRTYLLEVHQSVVLGLLQIATDVLDSGNALVVHIACILATPKVTRAGNPQFSLENDAAHTQMHALLMF